MTDHIAIIAFFVFFIFVMGFIAYLLFKSFNNPEKLYEANRISEHNQYSFFETIFSIFTKTISIIILGGAIYGIYGSIYEETKKEPQTQTITDDKNFLTDLQKADYCKMIKICKKFNQERYNCSTAGNYNTCMSIRLKREDLVIGENNCKDGEVIFYKNYELPNSIECFLINNF